MSEFLNVKPEIWMVGNATQEIDNSSEVKTRNYPKLVVALGAGALALTGCTMPQEKTATVHFNVICESDSNPVVTEFNQQDKPTRLDTDTVSVACMDSDRAVGAIKGITKTESAAGSNVTVVYRYGDGFMQEGKPQITTDILLGEIGFYGESTIESAEVTAGASNE